MTIDQSAPKPPPLLSAADFIAQPVPERTTILDPILTSKTLALLYGPRGLGKTFVALGIAHAAASGGSFLGWQASRPHRVLYIDGEMAADEMKKRLLNFGPPPPTLSLMLADLDQRTLLDLTHFGDFSDLQKSWGDPELVIIDNLASLSGLRDGHTDRWHQLQFCLTLQRRIGRGMLLIHHANKKGAQRGTSQREDLLDLVIAMRRPPDYEPQQGARFQLHFEKARGLMGKAVAPIEAHMINRAMGGMHWNWRPALESDLERMTALLKHGLTVAQIARELKLPRGRAYRLHAKAVETGLV